MPNPSAARVAPIIHLAMMSGSLMILGVLWLVRGGVPIALLPSLRSMLAWVAYAVAAMALLVAGAIRGRIPSLDRSTDFATWWVANNRLVLLLWIAGDAACVIGAVLWFLTDNQLVLLALSGSGLLILGAYRPSKLFYRS